MNNDDLNNGRDTPPPRTIVQADYGSKPDMARLVIIGAGGHPIIWPWQWHRRGTPIKRLAPAPPGEATEVQRAVRTPKRGKGTRRSRRGT